MKFNRVGYSQLNIFPKLIRDYLSASPSLRAFYHYPFDFEYFREVISDKKMPLENREVLSDVLSRQYGIVNTTSSVKNNIEKLRHPDTFCITTAHQPVLFTGPLYVIYKIISAINIAGRLCHKFPGKHFVPVYCMGAEDHDFEEINHAWINGEKIEWKQESKGPVGKLSPLNIIPLISEAEKLLKGKPFTDEIIELLKESYGNHPTLAEATLCLIDRLFGEYGLLVLIPDNKALKQLFIPVIEQELMKNHSFSLTEQTNKELINLGYDTQVNPREINLFYLGKNMRERIVMNEHLSGFEVLNTSISFSKDEMLKEAKGNPENFSPNVMLRPLYQEIILPNLAYVGGAGELSYWLQQKKIFDHYLVNFPMLVLRNSAMIIKAGIAKKIDKAGLELADLFDEEEAIIQNFVKRSMNNGIDFTSEKEAVENAFGKIREKVIAVDSTLAGAVEAQKAGFLKGMESIETKVMRAGKRNFETTINQIRNVKVHLFPGNILQERVENFLPYYAQYGPAFLQQLMNEINPFSNEFLIAKEN